MAIGLIGVLGQAARFHAAMESEQENAIATIQHQPYLNLKTGYRVLVCPQPMSHAIRKNAESNMLLPRFYLPFFPIS
jgi:hypothetical protein